MSTSSFIMTILAVLMMVSILIGYIFTHLFVGPWLFKKHGKRNLSEEIIWFGNILNMEHDLKDLLTETKDPRINQTLRLIKACKYLFVICFLSLIVSNIIVGMN